jgi:triphosphoribosyl-dephospho-CoA synthase
MSARVDGCGHDGFRACVWEVTARKAGNVHRFADFADLTYLDFVFSAEVIRGWIELAHQCRLGSGRPSLGETTAAAIGAMRHEVRTNTHLGIILLLMPLAAVLTDPRPISGDIRNDLNRVLARLTVDDARHVYRAIRQLNPGGLGDAPEQDLRTDPTVTLLEAMKLAADRDMVARQYANNFADVFDFGVPAFVDAFARFGCVEAAIIDSQLRWLAAYPDSLIARKNGTAVASEVQNRAAEVLRLGGLDTPGGRAEGVALDRHLRSDGNRLNPGTTADLITACLFVALRENRVAASAPFRWAVPDWL